MCSDGTRSMGFLTNVACGCGEYLQMLAWSLTRIALQLTMVPMCVDLADVIKSISILLKGVDSTLILKFIGSTDAGLW